MLCISRFCYAIFHMIKKSGLPYSPEKDECPMNSMNRRRFLGVSSAAAISWSRMSLSQTSGSKLKMGLIGAGWYGNVMLKAALKTGEVEAVAICDVDSDHLEKSAAEVEKLQGSRPKTYKHFQELLDQPGLESVIIATPPHWHALPFLAACRKKLSIYLEKPVAYDIREGQAMLAAAGQANVIVQVGFQRRHCTAIRQAANYLQQGNAGEIVQVDAQIHYPVEVADTKIQPPPPSLDWELWCGPAPKLPYCPNIGHFAWRLEKEYGNGHLVDWGIHWIDSIRMTLGEKMPRYVIAEGGNYRSKNKFTTPDILTVHFEFARCPVVWRHRIWGSQEYNPEVQNAMFYYGEKQTVVVNDNKWTVLAKGVPPKVNEVGSDAALLHMQDFLQAVRQGKTPACTLEDALFSTATVQLAMVSLRSESRVQWDQEKMQVINNPAAAGLVKRPYRAPYQHPFKG
jgi:predicted dehydrogenase